MTKPLSSIINSGKKRPKLNIREPWWCENERDHKFVKWEPHINVDTMGRKIFLWQCQICGKEVERTQPRETMFEYSTSGVFVAYDTHGETKDVGGF